MKLRTKNFNWLAGRPVVVLNDETAKKLNVHVNERVLIRADKELYAVVDIFPKLVNEDQVGLSKELSKSLNLKNNSIIEISASELDVTTQLISKKMAGKRLSKKELNLLISEIVKNNLTEAEIAYFTAAQKSSGMTIKEIAYLTKAMVSNGHQLKFKKKLIADKHCIGGIAGNRTTPIIISICAAAGLILPKTSSKAITSASGTANTIATIAKIEFPIEDLKKIVKKTNACLVWGGALGLAPSDDKILHVERMLNLDVEPQLLASIMAKKIASGSKYVLIDIPFGESAKIKTRKQAQRLAEKFKRLAENFNIHLKCILTDGSQPIGNGIGPVLEMLDILSILQNKPNGPKDLREKSLFLASELMKLCKIKSSEKKALEILESGKAYEKFKQIINAQNSKKDFEKRIKNLIPAKFQKNIPAKKSGKISEINNKYINRLCNALGSPETIGAGVYLHKHIENVAKKGETILTLYAESESKISDGLKFIKMFKPFKIN